MKSFQNCTDDVGPLVSSKTLWSAKTVLRLTDESKIDSMDDHACPHCLNRSKQVQRVFTSVSGVYVCTALLRLPTKCSLCRLVNAGRFCIAQGFSFSRRPTYRVTVRNDMAIMAFMFQTTDLEYGHFVRCTNQIQQRRCEFEQWQSSALQK